MPPSGVQEGSSTLLTPLGGHPMGSHTCKFSRPHLFVLRSDNSLRSPIVTTLSEKNPYILSLTSGHHKRLLNRPRKVLCLSYVLCLSIPVRLSILLPFVNHYLLPFCWFNSISWTLTVFQAGAGHGKQAVLALKMFPE